MDPRSQKAGDFASKFLYDSEYDFAVKQAVRHQQSLEEVLEHSGIEKVWAQIQSSQNGNSGLSDSLEPVDSTSVKTCLLTVLPPEHLEKLSQPEHAAKLEVVESALESARKQVRMQIQTVDGSLSLDKLAKTFRAMECSKLRGSNEASVAFLYVVEAAGEHERDARRSPTPMRREHMEKVMHAWMCTRSLDLPDLESEKVIYPQLHASDVILGLHCLGLFFTPSNFNFSFVPILCLLLSVSVSSGLRYLFCDSGRQGTQQAFLNTFKACDGHPYAKNLFHLTFSEDSVRDHRKALSQSCLPYANVLVKQIILTESMTVHD